MNGRFRSRISVLTLAIFLPGIEFRHPIALPKIKTETMAVPVLRFILQILAAFHEVACWRC